MILVDLPNHLVNIRKQIDEATHELRYFSFKLEEISSIIEKKKSLRNNLYIFLFRIHL
jgi:hypothetical protein